MAPQAEARQYARVGPVAVALAPKLLTTLGNAHQIIHGPLNSKAACVIETFFEVGQITQGLEWAAPIIVALDGMPRADYTRALKLDAQASDSAEDMEELTFESIAPEKRTQADARRLVRARLREAAKGFASAAALAKEFGLSL